MKALNKNILLGLCPFIIIELFLFIIVFKESNVICSILLLLFTVLFVKNVSESWYYVWLGISIYFSGFTILSRIFLGKEAIYQVGLALMEGKKSILIFVLLNLLFISIIGLFIKIEHHVLIVLGYIFTYFLYFNEDYFSRVPWFVGNLEKGYPENIKDIPYAVIVLFPMLWVIFYFVYFKINKVRSRICYSLLFITAVLFILLNTYIAGYLTRSYYFLLDITKLYFKFYFIKSGVLYYITIPFLLVYIRNKIIKHKNPSANLIA